MKNIDYSFGENSVFIFDRINNKPIEITNDRLNYQSIIDAIKEGNEELVIELLDENQVLNNVSNGRVTVRGSTVLLDGKELHSAEAKKLVDLVSEGATNIDRWFRFIEKLYNNPSYHCRQQAYNFIKHAGMPMTETGNLIGYKGVADDYKDKYSGKFDNSVGQVLRMSRTDVDDNPNNGCSAGFHVGSHDYANSWAGSDGRLMIVEYSPTDIVSVPDESGYGKLRVCEYKVIAEHISRTKLNDGSYGYESNKTLHIWELIDELSYGIEPYRIPIDRIQEEFPDADSALILTSVREHSDYLASITFDDGNPSELILNS